MRLAKTVLIGLTVCVALMGLAEAQKSLDKMFNKLKDVTGSTSDGKGNSNVAQGLKEALQVGTEKAVARTSQSGGFFNNPLIKIVNARESFKSVEKGLRLAGYGSKVDEFILSMNSAAEAASPQAKQIFVNAITGSMSFTDANKILQGGETAATDFFKEKTTKELYELLSPGD